MCDRAFVCVCVSELFYLYIFGFYLCSVFYNKIASLCFTEAETQSRNPHLSAVAKKKNRTSLLTGRNLEQDQAHKEAEN